MDWQKDRIIIAQAYFNAINLNNVALIKNM